MVDGLHCKAVNPINCLPCHANESIANAEHVAAGYVAGGDAQDDYVKTSASCHDSGDASDATVSVTIMEIAPSAKPPYQT
jgi:hypothetical protein